jgi:pteridine reductase
MAASTAPKRVALVTGSGKKRIGWHIAVALADRGHDVAVHYRTSENEAAETVEFLRGRGIRSEAFQADLADESAVKKLIGSVLEQFGRLDVLVNCASIYQPKKLEDVTAADVRENFDANLLSTFLCMQHAGLAMVQQPEGGCIVNFGDWALARPYANYAAYFASKGAIPTMTRCFAVELGSRNPLVRVNCIHPGPILFPPDMPEAEREKTIRATLVKKKGTPETIASTVVYFVDNNFVTGVCLPVDGGRTIYASETRD